jgi:23S rRNA (cytosine1962-C5)-methyltransferase
LSGGEKKAGWPVVPALKLKPHSTIRAARGHPWVYRSEVQKPPPPEWDGEAVECRDSKGRLLGTGLCNSRSQIIWRRFTQGRGNLDAETLRSLIRTAVARRPTVSARRLVWSDSDDLPGLIVDQFGPVLVVQLLTLGMDRRREMILEILKQECSPESIVLRNDAPGRSMEQLPLETVLVHGPEPRAVGVRIGPVVYELDLLSGQKTGLYLDQVGEHARIARYAQGRRVLDAFCNQGGFALNCALAGAAAVTAIDLSAEAVAQARRHAERNRAEIRWLEGNVFDFFRTKNPGRYDLIVLDPPPFARSKDHVADALRGYKELNLRACGLLEPGGILATYSCSHHVTRTLFEEMVASACRDAGRTAVLLERTFQPPDHPVRLDFPESEYLHGLVVAVW